jgi:DNA-binding FadR family transcriptional regulator
MDGDFKPLTREPAYLKVCRAIEEKIVSGALADGASLPTEVELCDQFAVTRSTVREGIRMLEQTGLIVRGPAKRLFVRRPGAHDVAAATSRGLSLGGATFREVWESLKTIYPPAARLAASRIDAPTIEKLRAINADLSGRDDEDTEATVIGAVAFFHEIAGGLNNRVMLAMLDSLNMTIEASLRRVIENAPNARARIVAAQAHIIKALDARDGDAVETWMRRHTDDIARGCKVAGLDLDAPVL